MTITEKQRLDLRQKLDEVLGARLAEIAMEAMPPLDYDQFATKQDVANLGIELRGDMALMESRLVNEIASLRIDVNSELVDFRSGMDRQFRQYFVANVALIVTLLGLVVGLL